MSDYRFSDAERWAVFKTHGDQCYLNREVLIFNNFQIDHIIPETLLNDVTKLNEVLKVYGLPETFSINSFANWLPACAPCNNTKRSEVFEPTPIIQKYLRIAIEKADAAQRACVELQTNRKLSAAVMCVAKAIESDSIPHELMMTLLQSYVEAHPEMLQALQPNPRLGHRPKPDVLEYRYYGVPEPIAARLHLRFTPFHEVIAEYGRIKVVRTSRGVGVVPTSENPDNSFICEHCDSLGPWSGARCLTCGQVSEPT